MSWNKFQIEFYFLIFRGDMNHSDFRSNQVLHSAVFRSSLPQSPIWKSFQSLDKNRLKINPKFIICMNSKQSRIESLEFIRIEPNRKRGYDSYGLDWRKYGFWIRSD